MTKNTNTSMRRFAAKCLWIWGMAMAFVASAEAENKATIDNFNIKVGEEKTISVYLENSDPMVGATSYPRNPGGCRFGGVLPGFPSTSDNGTLFPPFLPFPALKPLFKEKGSVIECGCFISTVW